MFVHLVLTVYEQKQGFVNNFLSDIIANSTFLLNFIFKKQ
jgi:hypothetical protein